jgi:hypothetical protein
MEGPEVIKIFITSKLQGPGHVGQPNGSTDVIVLLNDGHKYTASFFSFAYLEQVCNRNKISGEFLGGKYFWAKNIVLVEECSDDIINPVVADIIEEGEFNEVFRKL